MRKLIFAFLELAYLCACSHHPPANKGENNNEVVSAWETKYFVDEFNKPTDEAYKRAFIEGTFSNSAATNSKLGVNILVEKTAP